MTNTQKKEFENRLLEGGPDVLRSAMTAPNAAGSPHEIKAKQPPAATAAKIARWKKREQIAPQKKHSTVKIRHDTDDATCQFHPKKPARELPNVVSPAPVCEKNAEGSPVIQVHDHSRSIPDRRKATTVNNPTTILIRTTRPLLMGSTLNRPAVRFSFSGAKIKTPIAKPKTGTKKYMTPIQAVAISAAVAWENRSITVATVIVISKPITKTPNTGTFWRSSFQIIRDHILEFMESDGADTCLLGVLMALELIAPHLHWIR
jgi:hypothetical protein